MSTISPLSLRRVKLCISRFLFVIAITLAIAITVGCGSGGSMSHTTTPPLAGNTMVTVLSSSTANDQLSQFIVGLSSLTLTSQSGKTVTLLATPQRPEFIHVNGSVEPLTAVNIPQDVYTSATVVVGTADFDCVSQLPGELQVSGFSANVNPPSVALAAPITVTGTAMSISLNLQVSESAMFPSCYLTDSPTYSITPTFTLAAQPISSQPTNAQNGEVSSINGLVSSVAGSGGMFSLITADGITVSLNANGSTVYQKISGFNALATGIPVDVDSAIQSDGSLLATRVEVDDADATSVSVVTGPLMLVAASVPVLSQFGREEQGYLFSQLLGGAQDFNFSGTIFQISGQLANLQNLPFAPTFNDATMFAGQNVAISSHATAFAGGPAYIPATTMTLMPQTVNGTVTEVSSSGSFSTYTIQLPAYDLIPNLAVQPGQTTVLTDPNTVVVYVDSNTQQLNSNPLTVGGVLRFNGLLFNDGGTLRMDCGQIDDGVTE